MNTDFRLLIADLFWILDVCGCWLAERQLRLNCLPSNVLIGGHFQLNIISHILKINRKLKIENLPLKSSIINDLVS